MTSMDKNAFVKLLAEIGKAYEALGNSVGDLNAR
jgi:hypothetical protein